MSQYTVIENDDNLTTDAVPDAPRENIKPEPLIIEEPEKAETETNTESDQNRKTNISYPINTKKKNPSSNTTNSNPKKKSANGSTKTTHACTKVINVLNSSGVHIGAVNNYNLYSNTQNKQKQNGQQKENIVRTAAVDRIISSDQSVKPEHINFVSTHLGEGWREVGETLGYSKGQMDHFYADNKNVGLKEVVYKMLLDWTQVRPEECKIGTLAAALWDADQKDVVCRWSKNY